MPYIKQQDRKKYDELIAYAVNTLTNCGCDPKPGEINYVLSSIIWSLFDDKPGYTRGSMLIGVLDDVKEEFRRRKINPYEDDKILENGDL
jgi:hypothetical protein